jgi:hypothetical protein
LGAWGLGGLGKQRKVPARGEGPAHSSRVKEIKRLSEKLQREARAL